MRSLTTILAIVTAVNFAACDGLKNGNDGNLIIPDDSENRCPRTDQCELRRPDKTWTGPRPKLLVLPSANFGSPKSYGTFTFELIESLAENLEEEPEVTVLNAPMVISEEQAKVVDQDATAFDHEAARRLATKMGATHYLTGRTWGYPWNWELAVEIYAMRPDGTSGLIGIGRATRNLMTTVPTRGGGTIREPSGLILHGMFADAVSMAFADIGLPLATHVTDSVREAPSKNGIALLNLSRAYAKNFWRPENESPEQAEARMKSAERAVRIDPRNPSARRFFAHALQEAGKPREAMPHYAAAIKVRPNDVRSLVRLGVLEAQEGDPIAARGHLERATGLRPDDADIWYWFGRATLALGEYDAAIPIFRRVEAIDPNHVECRRELVKLYTARQDYVEAIRELRALTGLVPEDRIVRFDLAACIRATGRDAEAASIYELASADFPQNALFHKFRGDVLGRAGDAAGASRSYHKAREINYEDRRVAYLLGKAPLITVPPLGAYDLIEAVRRTETMREQMNRHRRLYYLGLNDAILDLALNGPDACLDGHGASSALFALQERDRYAELFRIESELSKRMARAKTNGEWMWLTPDERDKADAALEAAEVAMRDDEEMGAQYRYTFRPLYMRNECELYGGMVSAATEEQVRERHANRAVSLPEFERPPMLPISPIVPANQSLVITFTVDNTAGDREMKVVVDRVLTGSVAAGSSISIRTSPGPHDLCLAETETECGRSEMIRQVNLYDGWTIQM